MFKKIKTLICMLVLFGNIFGLNYAAAENKNIILVTTTSVQDTGLLDVLVGEFQKKTGCTVKAIAVGTGQAIQLGKTGEADILWVHSPDDEKQFVDEGFGIQRTTFMHNDFVILGPKDDPAKILGTKKASDTFKKIAEGGALFVSRGDNSGTHKKEKKIWKEAGVLPDKTAYIEVGQGMAATLGVANEKYGYCLSDKSTYLSLRKSIDLVILCEGDDSLINRYSLILVNPDKFPQVNAKSAKDFLNFMLSKEAKNIINAFGKGKFGKKFFFYDYEVK